MRRSHETMLVTEIHAATSPTSLRSGGKEACHRRPALVKLLKKVHQRRRWMAPLFGSKRNGLPKPDVPLPLLVSQSIYTRVYRGQYSFGLLSFSLTEETKNTSIISGSTLTAKKHHAESETSPVHGRTHRVNSF